MPENRAAPMLPKAPTGIAGFDDLTFGGLPAGRPSLVCGSAGCGKTLLATTFLVNGAPRYDEPGVFMSFEQRAEDLAAHVASLGYDLDGLVAAGKLAIDHVRVEPSEIEETGAYDPEGLFIRLGFAVDGIGAKRWSSIRSRPCLPGSPTRRCCGRSWAGCSAGSRIGG